MSALHVLKGQIWGQGQTKGQDIIIWEILVNRGENFRIVIFAEKNFLSKRNLRASSMVLFSYFYVAYFGQKRIWKFYLWVFSKLLDNIKAIFEPIDLKFGIYI